MNPHISEDPIHESDEHAVQVDLASFAGPLDLLLFLVRQHKIDLYDIPIANITEQYMQYLRELVSYNLEHLTSFYHTAAWLLLIKSKMLLPVQTDFEDEEEISDPRAELVQTLIEYQHYKKLSRLLEHRYDQYNLLSLRKHTETLPLDLPPGNIWKEVKAVDLLSVFMKLVDKPDTADRIINLNEPVTVNEKIAYMYELLEKQGTCTFQEIVSDGGIMAIVCTLLAVLELLKQQEIRAMQHIFHGEIVIVRKEHEYH